MLTHRNMVANLRQIHAWIAPAIHAEGEMFVAALPLYHVFALQVNGFVPLMIGASNLMIANPRDIPALVKTLRATPFTAVPGVNTLFNALLNNHDFASSISRGCISPSAAAWRCSARSPSAGNSDRQAADRSLWIDRNFARRIANPLNIDQFNGAIGLPVPSTEIAIRDDDGRDLKPGEAGELCIKGPQVMAGYWNRPDETANVMTAEGFLRTGDIAGGRTRLRVRGRSQEGHDQGLGLQCVSERNRGGRDGSSGRARGRAVGVPDARTGEAVSS